MTEEWRPVTGYEDLYEVSSFGRVKSLPKYHCEQERILALGRHQKGYLMAGLYKDGKSRTMRVHRLVAEAFLPNPQNLPIINHKDENPANNRVDNLEWCSYSYNNTYGERMEKVSAKRRRKVGKFTKDGELVEVFDSLEEASEGLSQGNIWGCCNGDRRSAYGFNWRYL